MSLPRALPTARVMAALELVLDGALDDYLDDRAALDHLLATLGVPPLVGTDRRLDVAAELVEAAQEYHRLERDGTAALADDLPPGVSRARVLDAELERLYGEAASLIRRLGEELVA